MTMKPHSWTGLYLNVYVLAYVHTFLPTESRIFNAISPPS